MKKAKKIKIPTRALNRAAQEMAYRALGKYMFDHMIPKKKKK